MLKGNRGEWSEAYVLLRLLGEGALFAADENRRPNRGLFFPIVRIVRHEPEDRLIEFYVERDGVNVRIEINGETVLSIPRGEFIKEAEALKSEISAPHDASAFPVVETEEFLASLGCSRIKAPSVDKTDISLELYDPRTGYESLCGFSIKSELGNPSTLLNASSATNFTFKVEGIGDQEIDRINSIEGNRKISERMKAITAASRNIRFYKVNNNVFADNLKLIDSKMDAIIAEALLIHYRDGVKAVSEVTDILEEDDPLDFEVDGLYRYKMKKFLCAVALGFKPATVWDGRDEANGGYIIVTEPGDTVAYHIYNRDLFEDYLFGSTVFERASTGRHHYCLLRREGKGVYLDLNLQIRF